MQASKYICWSNWHHYKLLGFLWGLNIKDEQQADYLKDIFIANLN